MIGSREGSDPRVTHPISVVLAERYPASRTNLNFEGQSHRSGS